MEPKKTKMDKSTRVLIGMTGGQDSTTAAYLLKKQGVECIGVGVSFLDPTVDVYKTGLFQASYSPNLEKIKSICESLEMPFYAVKAYEDFEYRIIDELITATISGLKYPHEVMITRILMDILYLKKEKLKCDFVSTGHYARIHLDGAHHQYLINQVNDKESDQSYLLSRLDQKHLENLICPLSELRRSDVSKLSVALDLDLMVDHYQNSDETKARVKEQAKQQSKKDKGPLTPEEEQKAQQQLQLDAREEAERMAQNLQRDGHHTGIANLIKKRVAPSLFKEGDIVDELTGLVIGPHKGLSGHYVGQTQDLAIYSTVDRSGGQCIVNIDPHRNLLHFGYPHLHKAPLVQLVNMKIHDRMNSTNLVDCYAQVGDVKKLYPAKLKLKNCSTALLHLTSPIDSAWPGEIITLYSSDKGEGSILASGYMQNMDLGLLKIFSLSSNELRALAIQGSESFLNKTEEKGSELNPEEALKRKLDERFLDATRRRFAEDELNIIECHKRFHY